MSSDYLSVTDKYLLSENKIISYSIPFVLSLLIFFVSRDNFFFWDTISQVSIPANWYFDTDFKHLFVPDDLATGHPTAAGAYLAIIWKLFGRSLIVSHVAMFPFVFGTFFQINRLISKSGIKGLSFWLIFVITIIDPTLIAQMSLISIDVIHIFFFLWCFNSHIEKRNVQVSLAFLGLCMVSLRGMISGAGVAIFILLDDYLIMKKVSIKRLFPIIPGLILTALFFILFYTQKHWIIHNVVSDKWSQSSQFASFKEMIFNIGIIGWRLVDFGRIGLWLVFTSIIFSLLKHLSIKAHFLKTIIHMILAQLICIVPVCVVYKNPIGHRYFLSIIVLVSITSIYWILKYHKLRAITLPIVVAILISGWFWIYPKKISTGWDATPAHWPYYEIRSEMLTYLHKEKINISDVGSFYPNLASIKYIDLSDKDIRFKEADIKNDKYILYSNVYNLENRIINELFNKGVYKQMKRISKGNIDIILFMKD